MASINLGPYILLSIATLLLVAFLISIARHFTKTTYLSGENTLENTRHNIENLNMGDISETLKQLQSIYRK